MDNKTKRLWALAMAVLSCTHGWAQDSRGIGTIDEKDVPTSVLRQAERNAAAERRAANSEALKRRALERAEKMRATNGGHLMVEGQTHISVDRQKLLERDSSALDHLMREIDAFAMRLPHLDIRYHRVSRHGEGEDTELTVTLAQYIGDMPAITQTFRVARDSQVESLSFPFVDPNQPGADPSTWISDERARNAALIVLKKEGEVVTTHPCVVRSTASDLELTDRFFRVEGDAMTAVPYFHYRLSRSGYAAEVNMQTGEATLHPLFREF